MPRSIREKPLREVKRKYHEKTLSDDAIYTTWIRNMDIYDLHAEYVWLQIPIFDLTQIGMIALADIAPVDFQPLSINFRYRLPTREEVGQGIWMVFEPIDFSILFDWYRDPDLFIQTNVREEYWLPTAETRPRKAIYGRTPYGVGYYDPSAVREFIKSTLYKLRLIRTPDATYRQTVETTREELGINREFIKSVYNRLALLMSAQRNAFILGLAVLGRSRLSEVKDGYAAVPVMDYDGKVREARIRTLDHIQMGFILGLTPLGYGYLLPKNTIYRPGSPPFIRVMTDKIRDIRNRVVVSTYAYPNYNKPEEMVDAHRSDRATQYHILQMQRRHVEEWVKAMLPPEESNPVRIRQYQNAMLQLVAWAAKRHRWGYNTWRYMTEEEFRNWWISYWTSQGLNKDVLNKLYEGSRVWLRELRLQKLRLGEKVKHRRRMLAGTPP